MSTHNTELLEQTMRYILDHPETHIQSCWIAETECGTAACFAGWAALLAEGWHQVDDMDFFVPDDKYGIRHYRDAKSLAIELLGLTEDEARVLFCGSNTATMLESMVKDLVNDGTLRNWWFYSEEDLS